MNKLFVLALALLPYFGFAATFAHQFKRIQITDQFWAEGATVGDFNRDKQLDVAYGPFWFEGPEFMRRHEFAPATAAFKRKGPQSEELIPGFEGALGTNNMYSECFLMFTYDFNRDGWPDILIYGFPGKETPWC